jgi:tRNA threonylcarbamoyladenosine biosynthesis protein TsaE
VKIALKNEAATVELANELWRALPDELDGWTLLLRGELGSGKSTFARALIKAAGHQGPVPSPTYTLVEPYAVGRTTIYHVDLYRIADEEELRYLGWDELEHGFRLVEWPERAPGLLAAADVSLVLLYDGDGRVAQLSGMSDRGRRLVEALSITQ